MTKPRLHNGRAEESQARGRALAGNPGWAWNVNLNNGNSNNDHQDNQRLALAVRGPVPFAGECQGAVTFRELHDAWRRARRQKCSHNQLAFESRAHQNLLRLERELNAGTWSPGPSLCFIARCNKAREIHAPTFSDRVVHHWLVPQIEALFEPRFIFDSYANRTGKGAHAAVERLEDFARQVSSGQGGGWYLQLDIKNFFNSIDRRVLWRMVKRVLEQNGASRLVLQTTHALLRQSPLAGGVKTRASAADLALVPPHKRLANARRGCGMPIGSLPSQFLANVYLDPFDQFVKRRLGVKRYERYVDDFVLVHRDRAQLQAWLVEIQRFLRNTLHLELKDDIKLRPLSAGIDFLGYIVRPSHTLVRRRVTAHAVEKLQAWSGRHVAGGRVTATPEEFRKLRSVWSSYEGHFAHADSFRLRRRLHRRFPWLADAIAPRTFDHRLEGRRVSISSAPRTI